MATDQFAGHMSGQSRQHIAEEVCWQNMTPEICHDGEDVHYQRANTAVSHVDPLSELQSLSGTEAEE
jgi:hypothetical protein